MSGQLRLLTLPYHLGRERVGMGKGPDRFVDARVLERARTRVLEAELEETRRPDEFSHEIAATFSALRAHAKRVRMTLDEGGFPLTLGGNCSTTVATVAALGDQDRLGVVWFDAHGDGNTPETTVSGFLDGMSLAILAGWCWQGLAHTVPGFRPVPEPHLMLTAVRDIDSDEQRLLDASKIAVVPAEAVRTPASLEERFLPALDALATRVNRVYVHIDLDCIDVTDGRANEFATPDGLGNPPDLRRSRSR